MQLERKCDDGSVRVVVWAGGPLLPDRLETQQFMPPLPDTPNGKISVKHHSPRTRTKSGKFSRAKKNIHKVR